MSNETGRKSPSKRAAPPAGAVAEERSFPKGKMPDETGKTAPAETGKLHHPERACAKKDPTFTKRQLLKSNWYSHKRDLLSALLADDRQYSHAEVDQAIDKFMKGKVD